MSLECGYCGAPLQIAENQAQVTCAYCQQVTRLSSTAPKRLVAVTRSSAPVGRIVAAVSIASLCIVGAIVAFVVHSSQRAPASPPPSSRATRQAMDQLTAAQEVEREALKRAERLASEAEARASRKSAMAPSPEKAEPEMNAPTKRAGSATKAAAKKALYTGPVLSKQDAERALEPEILSCMKRAGVYYLITRLGNDRRGGSVPALRLKGTSVVDYAPAPGFARTPLGQCVARAGRAVHAPAYRGNYIYVGLHNDAVPDPLGDASAHLDRAAASKALSALDEEARDCGRSHPDGSRPGESTTVSVTFQGASGRVSKIRVLYVKPRSPYARCIVKVYREASTARFKRIEERVTHVLRP